MTTAITPTAMYSHCKNCNVPIKFNEPGFYKSAHPEGGCYSAMKKQEALISKTPTHGD